MSLRSRPPLLALIVLLVLAFAPPASASAARAAAGYRVGVGIGDVTGEAAEVGMLGYAGPGQTTAGIASRQWARAFVVADGAGQRVAFVSAEVDFITQAVQVEVLRRLRAHYGAAYTDQNVVLHRHPHALRAGRLLRVHPVEPDHPRLRGAGLRGLVAGIVRAVAAADTDLAPGTVKFAEGTLTGANVNRSLEAFRRNPAADRARSPDAVDRRMTVLRFEQGGAPVGMLDFFATHGTSMTQTNQLISADNKGYAAHLIEHDVHGVDWAHRGDFVAAFAQTNAGDMSPEPARRRRRRARPTTSSRTPGSSASCRRTRRAALRLGDRGADRADRRPRPVRRLLRASTSAAAVHPGRPAAPHLPGRARAELHRRRRGRPRPGHRRRGRPHAPTRCCWSPASWSTPRPPRYAPARRPSRSSSAPAARIRRGRRR